MKLLITGLMLAVTALLTLANSKTNPNRMVILVTSNIDGVIRDCQCSGVPMGGFARMKTVIDRYRAAHANLYLIDTGDHFTSFHYPEKNRKVIELMKRLEYDFVLKADFDFMSGKLVDDRFYHQQKERFNYYTPRAVIYEIPDSIRPPYPQSFVNDSPFLVFHGDYQEFQTVQERFSNKRFIFLSHSQEVMFKRTAGQVFLQSGFDTEYIAALHLKKENNIWQYDRHEFIRLDETVQEDPAIKAEIDAFFKKLEYTQPVKQVTKNLYFGAQYCKACHAEDFNQWKDSNHAHAFETLKQENRAFDANCVGCHTTGFAKGGFTDFAQTPQFADVQCESCHVNTTPDHYKAEKRLTRSKVGVATCLNCHTPDNSPKFDYKTYLTKIRHW